MQSVTSAVRPVTLTGVLVDSARVHSPIFKLIVAYGLFGLLTSSVAGRMEEAWPFLYVQFFFSKSALLVLLYVLARVLHGMLIVRPARLLEHIRWDFTANPEVHRQLAAGLPLVLAIPLFLSVFASLKVLIPDINPFGWDTTFARWDKLIHGNEDPWHRLQPLLGHPAVTYALDRLYSAWFYVVQVVCIWQAFSVRRPQLRMQFFFSFLLVWILLGNLAATALSSAGPCFYHLVAGNTEEFQAMRDYLNEAAAQYPLWSVGMQKQLWYGFLNPEVSITRGISAMPSIHVAMAFLLALLGWRINRVLGLALTAYLASIMIGTVHLGWHYAIDGYAGIVGTYAIWRAMGWLLSRGKDASVLPSRA